MIAAAHANLSNWEKVGSFVELQRGNWLVARAYIELGLVEPALVFARKTMEITAAHHQELADFDRAFAKELAARAWALAGNIVRGRAHTPTRICSARRSATTPTGANSSTSSSAAPGSGFTTSLPTTIPRRQRGKGRRIADAGRRPIRAARPECVAVVDRSRLIALLEPLRALRRGAVVEAFRHDIALRPLLDRVVADGRRRVERLLEIAVLDRADFLRMLAPRCRRSSRLATRRGSRARWIPARDALPRLITFGSMPMRFCT